MAAPAGAAATASPAGGDSELQVEFMPRPVMMIRHSGWQYHVGTSDDLQTGPSHVSFGVPST